jgi:hypothetical protein
MPIYGHIAVCLYRYIFPSHVVPLTYIQRIYLYIYVASICNFPFYHAITIPMDAILPPVAHKYMAYLIMFRPSLNVIY